MTRWEVKVKRNTIKYLNGTTQVFYSYGGKTEYNDANTGRWFNLRLWISSEEDVYEQYEIDHVSGYTDPLITIDPDTNESKDELVKKNLEMKFFSIWLPSLVDCL